MGWFNKKEEVPRLAPAQSFPDIPKSEQAELRGLPELPSFPSNFANERLNQEMVKSAVDDLPSPVENDVIEEPITERFPEPIAEPMSFPDEKPLIPFKQEVAKEPALRFPEPSYTEPSKKHKPAPLIKKPLKEIKPAVESAMVSSEFPLDNEPAEPSKVVMPEIAEPNFEPEITHETQTRLIRKGKSSEEEGPVYVRLDKFESAQKSFETIKLKIKDIEGVLRKIQEIKGKEEEELKAWTDEIHNLKSRLEEIDSEIFDQI